MCLAAALLLLAVPAGRGAPAASGSAGETVHLTVLGTTDTHGNLWPYDYLAGKPVERGLAKVASYVKQVRTRQPNTLVVDSGDSFQGSPLAYLSAVKFPREANPLVAAMNAIGYDAIATGNHDFEFGAETLCRLRKEARFPILAANVVSPPNAACRSFPPFVIRQVGGVRVAILGMVTPSTPHWVPPEDLQGYEFRDIVETAQQYVPRLRREADLVLIVVHSGLGRGVETVLPQEQEFPEENRTLDLAQEVPGIDAIFVGHSHGELAGREVNGVLLVQAKYWGQSVAQVEFLLARQADRWKVRERHSRVVPMDAAIAADPEVLELTRAAHERTQAYLNTVVGHLERDLDGRTGRFEDNPLVDLIQRAQLHHSQAEVSLATLFSNRSYMRAGPVRMRDVYRLYYYDNRLYMVEITGAQLKEVLEYAAGYFRQFPWPEGSSSLTNFRGYHYDMAEGVSYRIDLSRPPGKRILDLQFQGAPLAPDRRLRLALNSHRWSGGGGYEMIRHARIIRRVGTDVRELIADYLRERHQAPTDANHNWAIFPSAARDALLRSVPPD